MIGALRALAQKSRGHLRVEDRRGAHAERMDQHLHVLRAGMEHLERIDVGHELGQGRKVVDGQRIDDHALVGRRHLHQAEFGVVRALAQKLGIDGDGGMAARSSAKRG